MADQEDLNALIAGDNDLAERDLRAANLTSLDLAGRDFQGAHLEKANFSHSNLSGSTISNAKLTSANFSACNMQGIKLTATSVFACDFQKADLTGSDLSRSHFSRTNMNGSIIIGADFRNCHINEGSTFDGVVSDETTLFDGATIFRPLARDPAFRFYSVERGKLVRKSIVDDRPSPFSSPAIAEVLSALNRAEKALREAIDAQPSAEFHGGIGHNGPPFDSALLQEESAEIFRALSTIAVEARKVEPDTEEISSANGRIAQFSSKIGEWASKKASIFSDELARELGKQAADIKLWIGLWLVASGQLTTLVEIVARVFAK